MPPFALIADRFFQLTPNRIVDLSSGDAVWMRLQPNVSSTRDWLERCAALYAHRHPHLVELVDYGAVGRGRFEAFRIAGDARRWLPADEAMQALEACAAFLVAQGLSPGNSDESRVIDVEGRPRSLPDEMTGIALGGSAPDVRVVRGGAPAALHVGGTVVQPRGAVSQAAEFLDRCWSRGPRSLSMCAPAGSGASLALQLVAREARLRGIVPLTTRLFDRQGPFKHDDTPSAWLLNELGDRHVVLLHDRDAEPVPAQMTTLARFVLGMARPRLHVALVHVVDRTGECSSSVVLEPFTPQQLLGMLGKSPGRNHRSSKLMHAMRTSHGWPGRFARALGISRDSCLPIAIAREHAPKFSATNDSTAPDQSTGTDFGGCRYLVEARRLTGRGRHAAAIRAFRQAIGACDRRGDQLHAGCAWSELGCLLLTRGAADSARHAFEEAGQRFTRSGALRLALDAAAGEAQARIESGQLKEAETILRTADMAASALRAERESIRVRTTLLRCLYWQGRWDEANSMVERQTAPRQADADTRRSQDTLASVSAVAEEGAELCGCAPVEWAHWHCVAAMVAIQRHTLADAARHVAAAITASARDRYAASCASHAAAVRLHGWIGDAEAVRLHATRGLEAARAVRAPLELLRLRVNLIEALDQVGSGDEARRLALQLLRIRASRIPPLLRAEMTIALARVLPHHVEGQRRRKEAETFAQSVGAAALLCRPTSGQSLPKPLCDIVDIVQHTHEYTDEQQLLQGVADLLCSRLHASSVAFVLAQDAAAAVASAGATRGLSAQRAIDKAILIGPARTRAGIEIAAPIRCGSTTVGALECRWSVSGPDNAEHARALIVAAAAVSGPFLRSIGECRASQSAPEPCPELLGVSPVMTDLRRTLARAAAAPFPVLIVGESGVGKELVARAVHRESPRRLRNFASLNCAALTEELAEAELFGHARGAFTGAVAERRGLFEEADAGTLFLDEVSELSPRAQAKLLRVLQEGEVRRVGESFARHVDVRIVAATNRSLDAMAAERLFRQDLRYRLDVIRIEVPPLRHRIEDIPLLARAFWTRAAALAGCRASLSSSALAALARYDWPGNVRELQNVVSALIVAAPRHGMVGPAALPASIAQAATILTATTLDQARDAFERRFVVAALARAGGRKSQAARDLGITRQGLAKLFKRLRVS